MTRSAAPRPSAAPAALSVRGLGRTYGRGRSAVAALGGPHGVDLEFPTGSFTAVMGRSGSGKSTFLHCAAGLDRPSAGQVWWAGTRVDDLSEAALTRLRRRRVGFVFQSYNLVSALTVRDNLVLPLRLDHGRIDRQRLQALADRTGIAGLLRRRPGQLSGGQQQRVAVARALLPRPDVVFCDEPTGALDTGTAAQILALLRAAVDHDGQTVVMVTHDPLAACWADRVVFLADGAVVGAVVGASAERIAAHLAPVGAR